MRRSLAVSVRFFVLGAAFCALGGAAGCGQETWDLLANPGSAGALSGATGYSAGVGGADEGGRSDSAGAAGRVVFPDGGSGAGAGGGSGVGAGGGSGAGGLPCAGGFCMAGASCSPSWPFCTLCRTARDCNAEAPACDQNSGTCYQCRTSDDCPSGEVCNGLTLRCAQPCKDYTDCYSEPDHRVCNQQLHVCVSCINSTDCDFYGPDTSQSRCFQSACVECSDGRDCASHSCIAGRCLKPH